MKSLTIEIYGTGTHNRGAELMAIAIRERLQKAFPQARLAVSSGFGSVQERAIYGFYTTWDGIGRKDWVKSLAKRALPSTIKQSKALLSPGDVDIVLDASGFAISDQWGAEVPTWLYSKMQHPMRKSQPLIMLPQAFGPIQHPELMSNARQLFQRATLVCARDAQSFEAIKPLVDEHKLRKYPDFTVGISPLRPPSSELPSSFSAIVPNMRMLDKLKDGKVYLDFLNYIVQGLKNRGKNPVFVLHDGIEDRKVIDHLSTEAQAVPIFEYTDPRVLKGVLGQAEIVVGSRFHALTSALSQGVICIGAGWSHKYAELFKDFDCPDMLIADLTNFALIEEVLEQCTDSTQRTVFEKNIKHAAQHLKSQTEMMWQEVIAVIQTTAEQKL